MQASTASMCLRKLSDWVYSQSKLHADSRFIMVPCLFSPVFLRSFRKLYRFHLNFSIDNPKVMPETTASQEWVNLAKVTHCEYQRPRTLVLGERSELARSSR